MKRRTAFLCLIGVVFFCACEKDDVCVDWITPRLFVQFYESQDHATDKPTELTLANVTVTRDLDGKQEELYANAKTDTLYLPLRIDADISEFTIRIDEKSTDKLTIAYERKNQFVSKACGLKTIYMHLRETHTTDSIKSIAIEQKDILENEDEPGLYIYF